MEGLEQELREQANAPMMTAVKFTKENELKLCTKYNIGRGALRQIAVTLDKQTAVGFKVEETAKRKARKDAQKEEKVDKPKVEAKAKPKKDKPKPKAKKKAVAKKKSKPKD